MANIIRSVIQQDVALAPSITLDPIILPGNPLSNILFTIRALNNTGTITDHSFIGDLLAFITSVELRFKGQVIFGGSMVDLAILNGILTGFSPVQGNVVETNNDVRFATFLLSLSRVPYWREEAFPAVRAGDLTLNITSGAAPAGLDGFTIQVEITELLGATPTRFVKYTTQTRTFTATGQNDIDLPIGNPILGLLLFGTTVPVGASFNASLGAMRVLVENKEEDYANTNWETLHGELGRRLMNYHMWQGHFHGVNAAGAGQEDTQEQQFTAETMENYAYMDFDPLRDGSFALETEGKSRVQLRVTADVADLVRVLPVELFNVGDLTEQVPAPV